ncbi:hypothetical protein NBRC116589_13300 [Ruegeria sp. HU-ET01832]|uniref:hypothetical protein n=1 Tax=Ruegeria sp. HU-ET01832 TaxID=3135906 RepID=UPI0031089331
MSVEQNSGKPQASSTREELYLQYLQLLPRVDILAELDSLEEFTVKDQSVFAFGLEANRCFKIAIAEWSHRQLNHVAYSAGSGADLYFMQLQQLDELRDVAEGMDLKHLERSIRYVVKQLDTESDPSLSAIQNLLSELVRRARRGEGH